MALDVDEVGNAGADPTVELCALENRGGQDLRLGLEGAALFKDADQVVGCLPWVDVGLGQQYFEHLEWRFLTVCASRSGATHGEIGFLFVQVH